MDYSTADSEIADTLALLNVMIAMNYVDPEEESVKLVMAILKEQSKASLASSPNTDIFTKLGFRYPKTERVIDFASEEDTEVPE